MGYGIQFLHISVIRTDFSLGICNFAHRKFTNSQRKFVNTKSDKKSVGFWNPESDKKSVGFIFKTEIVGNDKKSAWKKRSAVDIESCSDNDSWTTLFVFKQ